MQIHYAASKAAIISITQSAALALAGDKINVNAVCPGVVLTEMWQKNARDKAAITGRTAQEEIDDFVGRIPWGRAGTEEEVADIVAFLCSAEADYITGQVLNIDGGFSVV
jgi:NAD(P)-dependent dehydrogenase (short-subunit alcohol dehydrogenase family)